MENNFKRNCPRCGAPIEYASKYTFKYANNNRALCQKCCRVGVVFSNERIEKMRNAQKGISFEMRFGKEKSDILKNKNSERKIGSHPPQTGKSYEEFYGEEKAAEIKSKQSQRQSGINNPMYGKPSPRKGKTYREIFGNNAESVLEKHSISLKNKSYEDLHGEEKAKEIKRKLRIANLNYLALRYPNSHIFPRYNPSACEYFNNLMEQTSTLIHHAENGGEFHIKELGYFVDGYDAENNIVYEFDEMRHFTLDGVLKEKDIKRQKEIEYFLGCKFIRIKCSQNQA